jgi:hypothetical protein
MQMKITLNYHLLRMCFKSLFIPQSHKILSLFSPQQIVDSKSYDLIPACRRKSDAQPFVNKTLNFEESRFFSF